MPEVSDNKLPPPRDIPPAAPENHSSIFDPTRLLSEASKFLKGPQEQANLPAGMADAKTLLSGVNSKTSDSAVSDTAGSAKPVAALKLESTANLREFPAVKRIIDGGDPVADISKGLDNLSNLRSATVTKRENGWQHVQASLEHAQTTAAPNINVRGFRPIASHVGNNISFDLAHQNGGVHLANMSGFSSDVRGPLGRVRQSDTSSMFLGKDAAGNPYLNTTSTLHFRRTDRTSTTTLRPENFPEGSPMRSVMKQPEALKNITSALRMFQNTDDVKEVSLNKVGQGKFDLSSLSTSSKHIELNRPLPGGYGSVKALDLDKSLSATIKNDQSAVSLENIKGMKVDVEMGLFKSTVTPTRVSLENGKDGQPSVRLDFKMPDGSPVSLSIPIAKLKEQARKSA